MKKQMEKLSTRQERAAEQVAGRLLKGQRKLADRLNAALNRFPRRPLQILLLLVGVLMGGYCLFLLLRACLI